jgi:zinc protease
MRRFLLVFAILFPVTLIAATPSTPVDTFVSGVRRTTLKNGLTVVTREVPGSGVVAVNTWVKAGYFHEPDEVAGMAHLFEHMFFKGSKKFPGAEEISEELAAVGGNSNAGTIYDITNYYFVLPKEGFRRALEIQADAIANPLFDAAELKKEAEVVIEESNRKRDNPPAMASELMYATAFEKHRMKRWRIGSNDVLRNIKRDNLLAFFETLYLPQNMILAVTGDVKHAEALKIIEETFGKLSRGTLDKKRGPVEPEQTAFRYGQASADLRQGYTTIGWHTPPADHADTPALDVLSIILGGGRSSRFFRNVVSPDAASTASASNSTFEDIGIFELDASFDEKNRAEVDRRLLREVERIKSGGPSAFELQLAKNLIESQVVLSLEDVLGQAQALGQAEVRGDARKIIPGDIAARQKLTAEDIKRVAKKYLTVENMTLFHYRAKGTPELTRDVALQSVRAAMSETDASTVESAALPATTAAPRAASGNGPAKISKLSNGATLIVRERNGAPVVNASIYFRGGRSYETGANAGITRLMTAAMSRGTTSRSGEQIDREMEFLGSQIGTDLQRDYFGFSFDVVARNLRPAVGVLADVVLHPTFPEDGVEEEKHLQKGTIKRNSDSATVRPSQLLYSTMYRNHPYALPPEGFTTSVDVMKSDTLRSWWSDNVTADDALVVIIGDVNADDARQIAEEAFASLPKRATPRKAVALPLVAADRIDTIEFRDRKQSAIALGFPAVRYADPDYVPLRLLQQITSGLAGTLFSELRGKRSLAYTVTSSIVASEQGGTYYAYMATDAAKEEEARKGLVDELRRHAADAVTDAIVARAKSSLAGALKLQRQTNSVQATEVARGHFFNLAPDYMDRFMAAAQQQTTEDIRKTVTRYLGSDNYVLAIIRGKK